ncbi:hypothetical protein FRUB_02054 [Fimbriiglobus ruber]|uniref:Uncharacterized protein n=1 Tax=Fimbriiglobus ruber TaxID=1908690 RepID=A0A225DXP1_9BACT|nr:hypothetical protein FRUB_02054 [Fimbriiglobus ruber]
MLGGPYRVEVYASGRPSTTRPIEPGTDRERALADWLAAHGTGWSTSYTTYAPGTRVVGSGFTLNLLRDGTCVLNHQTGRDGEWEQIIQRLTPEDVRLLREALGEE